MRLFPLIGSHGTGKTTVYQALKERKPEYTYFSTPARYLLPRLGYSTTERAARDAGRGALQLMMMNSWTLTDPAQNNALKPTDTVVTDRFAIDTLAYYLMYRETPSDFAIEKIITNLARHYCALATKFIYFPIGTFPVKGDEMRPSDEASQKQIDEQMKQILAGFETPETRIHRLKSTTVDERVKEILMVTEQC